MSFPDADSFLLDHLADPVKGFVKGHLQVDPHTVFRYGTVDDAAHLGIGNDVHPVFPVNDLGGTDTDLTDHAFRVTCFDPVAHLGGTVEYYGNAGQNVADHLVGSETDDYGHDPGRGKQCGCIHAQERQSKVETAEDGEDVDEAADQTAYRLSPGIHGL